jgi:superfamily II DNA or RNA helicase
VELELGWHADHEEPWSEGGVTDVANGQALCPACNLQKGAQVRYHDAFDPRPFQQKVINKALDGMKLDRDVTVVLASPGSGKTLAYQAAATYLFREGLIDYVAVFVPRVNLARQCETTWMWRDETGELYGDHLLFDPRSRLGMIRHIPNKLPLIPPGHQGVGFVTTYAALVEQPAIYKSWARANSGRFLLVADEAQFCGAATDDRGGGTRAGAEIEQLHEHAAHTLLASGTPYRSDGQQLVLADYEEPDENGLRKLVTHAEASYAAGIAEQYLRRFEAKLHDVRVRWKEIKTNTVREYDLSGDGADLSEVLRRPDVWQPIVDVVVQAVREKQQIHLPYRGLISCMEQSDAKRVDAYLRERYPRLRVELAISEEGAVAEQALRDFRSQPRDVLVTVRKAFIGYDCPEITVVGVLSNYRDHGHLAQLAGRGLRVLKGPAWAEQSCRIVVPDDPAM